MLTAMPPGPGPDCLVDVVSVLVDAAGGLSKAVQGLFQRRATSLPTFCVWLRGICLASDGGNADGQRDQGEEGLHDELLRSGKLENVIEKKLRFNEL